MLLLCLLLSLSSSLLLLPQLLFSFSGNMHMYVCMLAGVRLEVCVCVIGVWVEGSERRPKV